MNRRKRKEIEIEVQNMKNRKNSLKFQGQIRRPDTEALC
jgi:hypothetical protein